MLNEACTYDAKGQLDNGGFLDYRVPAASDMPMIEPMLVEVSNPAHSRGAVFMAPADTTTAQLT